MNDIRLLFAIRRDTLILETRIQTIVNENYCVSNEHAVNRGRPAGTLTKPVASTLCININPILGVLAGCRSSAVSPSLLQPPRMKWSQRHPLSGQAPPQSSSRGEIETGFAVPERGRGGSVSMLCFWGHYCIQRCSKVSQSIMFLFMGWKFYQNCIKCICFYHTLWH